jgi:hypothetical protein
MMFLNLALFFKNLEEAQRDNCNVEVSALQIRVVIACIVLTLR